jgi:hypothetical protein
VSANRVDAGVRVVIFERGGGRKAKAVVAEIFHDDLLVGIFLITYTQILSFYFEKSTGNTFTSKKNM